MTALAGDRVSSGTVAMPGDNMFTSYYRIGETVHLGGVDGCDAKVVAVHFKVGRTPEYLLQRIDKDCDIDETIVSREEVEIHEVSPD